MAPSNLTEIYYPQSWSDLPSELAGPVLCHLPSHMDRVRFAAACSHWRFTRKQHSLPQPLPWLAFPDGTFFGLPHTKGIHESFNLPNSATYHISCGDWLVFSHEGTCLLMDPFSKVTLTLPNLSFFCPMDEPAEIINGRVIIEEEMPGPVLNMDTDISLCKLTVCSKLLVEAIVDIGPLHTIAWCRPGSASWFVKGTGVGKKLLPISLCISVQTKRDWFWKDAPSRCAGYDMRDESVSKDLNTTTAWVFPRC